MSRFWQRSRSAQQSTTTKQRLTLNVEQLECRQLLSSNPLGLGLLDTSIQATAGQPVTTVVATITDVPATATTGSFAAAIDWGNGTTSAGTLILDPNGGFDVTGTTTYPQAGWYAVTVTVIDPSGTVEGTTQSWASVAPAPPTVDLKGQVVDATVGTAFSGTVATFTDVRISAATGDFTATIDWGDGTSGTGTVTTDPNGGFDVIGTHTYANTATPSPAANAGGLGSSFFGQGPGVWNDQFFVLNIAVTDMVASATATALGLARVAPAPSSLEAKGQDIQATQGTAFTTTVATFTSTDTTGAFTATIDWGDNTTSTGTVTTDPNGGFDVTGTHTYTTPISATLGGQTDDPTSASHAQYFVVAVTITDTQNQDVATVLSRATVAPAPPVIALTANNIQAGSGTPFTGVVATFTDIRTGAATGDFTATIDWGDGTSGTGTVTTDPNGGFDVTGTHTYTNNLGPILGTIFGGLGAGWFGPSSFGPNGGPGIGRPYVFEVSVTDTVANATAKTVGLAQVMPTPPAIVAKGENIQATSGTAFTTTVATFTSTDTSATTATFTATIDWGDGSSSTGTVTTDPNGGYDVTGTHTYFNAIVDPLPPGILGNDPSSNGPIKVIDQHYLITVAITDTQTADMAKTESVATVAPAPPVIQATATNIQTTSGTPFTGIVATFTDENASATTGDFTATINWGDSKTSAGTVTTDPNGGFEVTGTHTYTLPNNPTPQMGSQPLVPPNAPFIFTVTIQDTANDTATAQAFASVAPAPTDIQASGTQINAVTGQVFTGTVATFTSTNTSATTDTFTATINWGDGNSSTGTITSDPNGGYDVTGTHTYSAIDNGPVDPNTSNPDPTFVIFGKGPGNGKESFIVTVTIQNTTNMDQATAVSLASVTPTPPNLVASGQTLNLTAGQAFTGTVATFTDADGDTSGNFAATINWGDGKTSTGTITVDPNGGFAVGGTHTYANPGNYPVFVSILDTDGDKAFSIGSALVASTSTTSLTNVVQSITQSSEYAANVIIKDYQQFLGRAPGSSEIGYWANVMQQGQTATQVVGDFLSSAEFFQRAGNTQDGWVDALYTNLLSRSADAGGQAYWLQQLAGGVSKANIVQGFETSQEYEGIVTQNYYHQYLNRAGSEAEISYWVNTMQQGAPATQVLSDILGSQEYFNQQQDSVQNWIDSSYESLLARAPDPSSTDYWMNVLSESPQ